MRPSGKRDSWFLAGGGVMYAAAAISLSEAVRKILNCLDSHFKYGDVCAHQSLFMRRNLPRKPLPAELTSWAGEHCAAGSRLWSLECVGYTWAESKSLRRQRLRASVSRARLPALSRIRKHKLPRELITPSNASDATINMTRLGESCRSPASIRVCIFFSRYSAARRGLGEILPTAREQLETGRGLEIEIQAQALIVDSRAAACRVPCGRCREDH